MSEREIQPETGDTSPKRGSSLLRQVGSGFSQVPTPMPVTNDRTVISSEPPMVSVNVMPSALESPFHVGDRLGVYELTEYIGGGGMGSVYKAIDTLLHREVAIKILLPEAAGSNEAVLRFQNEARSAARLDHESVAKVYYVGEENGLPYLVFEFVAGINLRDLVRQRGPLPLSDAMGISLQVADSLAHAGMHGVVHRDVKPSNILLRNDGQVKLIDFGLARIVEMEDRDNDLTASGVTLGTFDYISPEQARDPRTVDIRSDIYSLGCSMFYMLTGRPPFPEGTVLQKLLQHQGDQPPHVRELRPELPEEIGLLLDRMLAKDPNHRFQSPAELRDQIGLLASQLGLRSSSLGVKGWTLPTAVPPSFLKRHAPWLLSVVALLVMVVGLDFYLNNAPQNRGEVASPFPDLDHLPYDPASLDKDKNSPGTALQVPGDELRKTPTMDEASRLVDSPSTHGSSQGSTSLTEKAAVDPGIDTQNPISQSPGEVFDSANLKIKPSPYWSTPDPYRLEGLNEPVAYRGNLSTLEKPDQVPDTSEVREFEEALHHKGPASNWPLVNGGGSRVISSNLNLPGMGTRYGLLTVGEPREGGVNFSSLAAACRAAMTGDIIELRYNGERVEPPLMLSGKNLVLRGGKGYTPSVVFRPGKNESVATDPDPKLASSTKLVPSTMISLGGGSLTVFDLSFRLELDEAVPAGCRTLFESRNRESIQLQRCCLSIQNRSSQSATFFRVTTSPSDKMTETDSILADMLVSPAKITLTDSVARGNATFLVIDNEQPVDCDWENGLMVTDGMMLDLRGSESESTGSGSSSKTNGNRKDRVRLSLKHVTVFADLGLCRLGDDRHAPPTIPVDFVCYDSILLISNPHAMITRWVDKLSADPDASFHYEGDRNYYQGFDNFLVRKSRDSKTDLDLLDFTAWQKRWTPNHETYSFGGRFTFVKTPDASMPLDQRGPADYSLSDDSENPTRYLADDGSNLGFLPERLPSTLFPQGHEMVSESP